MKNKYKLYFLTLLAVMQFFAYSLIYAQSATVYDYRKSGVSAQIEKYLCAPTDQPSSYFSNQYTDAGVANTAAKNLASNDLYTCINKIYRFTIVLASAIAVFFIVIGGYIYMSAEGNQESVDKAKSILVSSITALVILMGGFVLLKALNPDLIKFKTIQPTSVKPLDTAGWNDWQSITALNQANTTSQSFSSAEVQGCKSSTGTLEKNYYHFSQCSGSWANQPYTKTDQTCKEDNGTTSTIGTSGCGPSSLATILKNFGVNTDPQAIANSVVQNNGRICGQGTTISSLATIAQSNNMSVLSVNSSDAALKIVRDGGVVLASMGPGIFTAGGHYIVIYGIDSSGNYLTADSGPRNITKASEQDIKSSFKAGLQIKPK